MRAEGVHSRDKHSKEVGEKSAPTAISILGHRLQEHGTAVYAPLRFVLGASDINNIGDEVTWGRINSGVETQVIWMLKGSWVILHEKIGRVGGEPGWTTTDPSMQVLKAAGHLGTSSDQEWLLTNSGIGIEEST